MDGTAVARTVASMATSPVLSITEMSTGPRSDRNPTAAAEVEWELKVGKPARTPH
jgi:hypothetical protein